MIGGYSRLGSTLYFGVGAVVLLLLGVGVRSTSLDGCYLQNHPSVFPNEASLTAQVNRLLRSAPFVLLSTTRIETMIYGGRQVVAASPVPANSVTGLVANTLANDNAGFMGVAIRDVDSNTWIASKPKDVQIGGEKKTFKSEDWSSYIGKSVTLDFIDNYATGSSDSFGVRMVCFLGMSPTPPPTPSPWITYVHTRHQVTQIANSGVYTILSESQMNQGAAWKAFNTDLQDKEFWAGYLEDSACSGGGYRPYASWCTAADKTTCDGGYSGRAVTTVSGNAVAGWWAQITFSEAKSVGRFKLMGALRSFVLAYSTDNMNTWVVADEYDKPGDSATPICIDGRRAQCISLRDDLPYYPQPNEISCVRYTKDFATSIVAQSWRLIVRGHCSGAHDRAWANVAFLETSVRQILPRRRPRQVAAERTLA